MSKKQGQKLIKKRVERFVEWMVENPDLARKEYPEFVNKIEERISNQSSFETAYVIQKTAKLFSKQIKEVESCLPKSKEKKIKQYLSLLNYTINFPCANEIEQNALDGVLDELKEQKLYWERELSILLEIATNPNNLAKQVESITNDDFNSRIFKNVYASKLFYELRKILDVKPNSVTDYSYIFLVMKKEKLIYDRVGNDEYIEFVNGETCKAELTQLKSLDIRSEKRRNLFYEHAKINLNQLGIHNRI
ncbi:hypothetical protein [Marinifilum flexuosum]|uniref:Uncharacterized protein n=1 Tax=Marinifilum flexuosum TaxID=1117708 RepID=A0A419X9H7_9BACT|nr:hypothetical protein [Marinifilum flexuosum]RKE04427.1 hypothetical protein BXY64_1447 [Marinifilum flexuosum]